MVDIDPAAMFANHVSATDVSNAMNAQSPGLPAGTAKIGDREYVVQMNSSPLAVEGLNVIPLHTINGKRSLDRNVAQVRDGYTVQTNIVRSNGRRSALLTILKNGQASTLDIVKSIKNALPNLLAGLPKDLRIRQLFDQSRFVRAAINGVRGGGRGYQNGGTTFASRSPRLSLFSDHLRTVLAVKGSLRRAQQRRAPDGSGPF